MADNEVSLIIRIKNLATEELQNIGKSVSNMAEQAKSHLLGLGISFAGLSAVIFKSVDAARESEEMVNKLNVALDNQGNYTKEASKDLTDFATAMQAKTQFDDEAIVNAESLIASFGLEGEELKKVTKATMDLAQAKGMDLATAAGLVARTIGTSTNALTKQGIAVTGAANSTERLNSLIKNTERLYGGQAEAAAKGLGASIAMKNQMQDLSETLGAQFAPIVELTNRGLAKFIELIKKHPELMRLTAIILGTTVAILGLVSALAALAAIIPAVTAGLALIGITAGTISAPITLIVGAIGLLVGAIFVFKQQMYDAVKTVLNFFLDMAKGMLTGIEKIINKLQSLYDILNKIPGINISTGNAIKDIEALKKTLEDLKMGDKDFSKITDEVFQARIKALNAWVEAQKKANTYTLQDHIKRLDEELKADDLTDKQRGILQAQRNALKKKLDKESKDETKQIDDQEFADRKQKIDLWVSQQQAANKYSLKNHIDYLNNQLKAQDLSDKQRTELEITRNNLMKDLNSKNYEDLKSNLDLWVSQQQAADIYTIQSHIDKLNKILADETLNNDQRKQLEIDRNNLIVKLDDDNYAKKTADLNLWVAQEEAKGTFQLTQYIKRLRDRLTSEKLNAEQRKAIEKEVAEAEIKIEAQKAIDFKTWQDFMAGAVNSKNKEIAAIAKAMAIYDIGINTYKAAMGAYSALAPIPFVGPALGVIAAGAAIAYGAEMIDNVQKQKPALAEGGMIKAGGGTNVIVGEPGPRGAHDEAVIPLDDPETARRIKEATGGGGGDTTIILKVGEFEIANAVVRGYNKGRNLELVSQISSR